MRQKSGVVRHTIIAHRVQHFGKRAPRYSMAGTTREGPGPAGSGDAAGRAWHNVCLETGQRGFLARHYHAVGDCGARGSFVRYFLARYIAYEAQHGKLHRRVLVMADDIGLEQVTQLLHRSGRSPYRFLTIASWISFEDRTSRKFTLRSASTAGLR